MAANPSFDIVSKVEHQEVDNALRQTEKELGTRFDFRGTGAEIAWAGEDGVSLTAETEDRVSAALEVFKEKLIKRNISLKSLEAGEPRQSGKTHKIDCKIIQASRRTRPSRSARRSARRGRRACRRRSRATRCASPARRRTISRP